MNLKTKTFLTLSAATVSLTGFLSIFVYYSQVSRINQFYKNKYVGMSKVLSNSIQQTDQMVDILMRTALFSLRDIDRQSGLLSSSEYLNLAKKLGVTDIFIASSDGVFLRSSAGPLPKDQPNLFSFCMDYRNLIHGDMAEAVTPIVTSLPKGNGSYKFMMIPNHNRTRVLEVAVNLNVIAESIKNTVVSYPEISSLGFYSPNGSPMGDYPASSEAIEVPALDLFSEDFYIKNQTNRLELWKKVPVNSVNCCECKVKGLTSGESLDYSYFIRAVISDQEIAAAVASFRNNLIIFFLASILFSLIISHLLSTWLIKGITVLVERTSKYSKRQITSQELKLDSSDEIGYLSERLSETFFQLELASEKIIEAEKQRAIAKALEQKTKIASQVSHDIRSPLSALNMVVDFLDEVSEEKRLLIRNATQRINDIANMLLAVGRDKGLGSKALEQKTSVEMLSSIIDIIISEKRIEYRQYGELVIEADLSKSYGIFVNINVAEFQRCLSNLINNSFEAIGSRSGFITVSIESSDGDNFASVKLRDSGHGIPEQVLNNLGAWGNSYGKDAASGSGSGLGLHHAVGFLNSIGGKLIVEYTGPKGTVICLQVPRAPAPNWFVNELSISSCNQIVTVDDDMSIHRIWEDRIREFNRLSSSRVGHVKLLSDEQLFKWISEFGKAEKLFLIDYEFLNQARNGLDMIEESGIADKSILVTSRFEDSSIRYKCELLHLKMIPKGMASIVPFK